MSVTGDKKYLILYKPGQQPKVSAFWSISMYNLDDGSFVVNSLERDDSFN
ncbi:DUF1214 domain-containing protein [Pseudomonas sp. PSB11]|nr:hypothetical protein [Pseudomonas sp. PSB11]